MPRPETKYIVHVNDGRYGGGIDFTRKELDVLFRDWSEGKPMVDFDGKTYTVDDLVALGSSNVLVHLTNPEMCEMGDDYVTIKVRPKGRKD